MINTNGLTGGSAGLTGTKSLERAFDYVLSNRFYVQTDNQISACFSECSGVGVTIEKDTHHEGGLNDRQHILLKGATFTEVTLKRGLTNDLGFWGWIENVLNGKSNQRQTVSILVFNQAGETMQSWELLEAIPVGWKAPPLQADANSVAIEELTLAYEGLKVGKA